MNEEAVEASSASDVAAQSLLSHRNQHDLSTSHFPLEMKTEITDCKTKKQQKVVFKILDSELNKSKFQSWF